MLERGPAMTEPLQELEQRYLGVAYQRVEGDTVELALRGMPGRAFAVHTFRSSDGR
jgi:hypothetical protein